MGEKMNILKKMLKQSTGLLRQLLNLLINGDGRQRGLQVWPFVSTWQVVKIVNKLDPQRFNSISGSRPRIPSSLSTGLLPAGLVRGWPNRIETD